VLTIASNIIFRLSQTMLHMPRRTNELVSQVSVERDAVRLATKVASDSRVYKRQPTSPRFSAMHSGCIILSGFVRACSRPRIIRDTCADYCHLLAFGEYRRREDRRLYRMSPRSILGDSVTFLVTTLRADIWSSLTCAPRTGCLGILSYLRQIIQIQ